MIVRVLGALLVACAVLAAARPGAIPAVFAVASLLWLGCLRRRATARLVLLVAVLVRAPFLFADYWTNDLYRYVWEGRIQRAGFDPYEHAPADPALAHLRDDVFERVDHPAYASVYPPLAQAYFAGATALGLGVRGLRATAVALDVAVVGVLLAWLARTRREPRRAIVYAWCPLAVASAGSGHVDPLMLLLLAGAGWAFEAGRAHRGAALLAGAVLAKTVAVLLVPWLLARRPRAALTLGGVAVLGFLPYATPHLFDSLVAFGTGFAFNGSLARVPGWLGLAPAAGNAVLLALLAAWVAVVALTQPRFAQAAALALAGLLLLSPTVHFWYLTWFLVALPAAGLRRWAVPLLVWCVTVGFASETYRAHHADGAAFLERPWGTALEYAPVYLAVAWALWRGRARPVRLDAEDADVSGPPPRYAVVVPCRGEVENLRVLLPRWLDGTGAAAVVVADTPTGDGTAALAASLPRVRYVAVHERGYGAAVLAGFAAAGDVDAWVVCDADHVRGPEQVRALLAPLRDPGVALVLAARTEGRLTWPQRLGNALSSTLIAWWWGRCFRDSGPFRALRRTAWPAGSIVDRGYGINVEMQVRALARGLGVVEVALPASARPFGENRISATARGVARAGWGILRRLWILREETCARPS